jgi:hypothetical protein
MCELFFGPPLAPAAIPGFTTLAITAAAVVAARWEDT